jgi:hypothetical protein
MFRSVLTGIGPWQTVREGALTRQSSHNTLKWDALCHINRERLGDLSRSVAPEPFQLPAKKISRLLEKLMITRLTVIGVGPGPRLEGAVVKTKGHFGVNAVPQIDSMCLVLGGREEKFAQLEKPGIDIERPGFRKEVLIGQLFLQRIGEVLYVREAIAGHQILESQKPLAEPGPHVFFIILRVLKIEVPAY